MRRSFGIAGVVLLTLGALSAQAVIIKLTPLKDILTESTHICTARVDTLAPDRPGVILVVDSDLKGKLPARRLPINMKGDRFAAKDDHTGKMFKRLTKDLPVLVFVQEVEGRLITFGFTNGTWFQVLGQKDGDSYRWSFLHCETYFRRTFKGTTAELKQVVTDFLENKKEPPGPNKEEKPGYGPEVGEKSGKASGAGGPLFAVIVGLPAGGIIGFLALLFPAVFGGLAILMRRWAALMTVVFTGSTLLALYLSCEKFISGYWWGSESALWVVIGGLTVVGLLWAWSRHLKTLAPDAQVDPIPARTEHWTMVIISLACLGSLLGMRLFSQNLSPTDPVYVYLLILGAGFGTGLAYLLVTRRERWTTAVISLVFLGSLLGMRLFSQNLSQKDPVYGYLLLLGAEFSVGLVGDLMSSRVSRWLRRDASPANHSPRPALPTEGMILGAMLLACLVLTTRDSGPTVEGTKEVQSASAGESKGGPRLRRQLWSFQPGDRTDVNATPLLDGDRLYAGIIKGGAFEKTGRLHCLDRGTGKEVWQQAFGTAASTGGDPMKQMLSAPCLADGRLYVGEGFHTDLACRLFCLDAATGKKLWDFDTASKAENDLWPGIETNSHVESSPVVADGRVYFGAGDKGLYCLDAVTGKKLWQYPYPGDRRTALHIDANPVVVGNRVYCSSGKSQTFDRLVVFCVDVRTGKKVWETETGLPAWGSPAVHNGRVFVGLGNSRILERLSEQKDPKGAVLCLDAFDGSRQWQFDTKGTVHTQPVCDGKRVFAGSQDKHCYALDCRDGKLVWKRDLGSEVESTPALARSSWGDGPGALYVASLDGDLYCLDPATGNVFWHHDELTRGGPDKKGFSATVISGLAAEVRRTKKGEERRVYFAAGTQNMNRAVIFCLEEEWTDEEK